MKTTDKPIFQQFHLEGVKYINPKEAYNLINNNEAVLIDVRREAEIPFEGIISDNILNHPMEKMVERMQYISKNQNIILVCPGGVRSAKVANLLNSNGYPNVANLDGGFVKWKEMSLPFRSQIKNDIGASCCSSTKTFDFSTVTVSCCDNSNNNKSCC